MPTKREAKTKKAAEPVFLIRPALRNYGLDYLHIALLALVAILIAFTIALAYFKPGVVIKSCEYGAVNGTCTQPVHNSTQALEAAERVLASYAMINTTFSLLPYYALVNASKVSYLPAQAEWFVQVPSTNPFLNGTVFNFSMTLYDSNLSLASPFSQAIKPVRYTNNTVVAPGTVSLYGRALCTTAKPMPVYLITDPYSVGAISSLYTALSTSKRLGSEINMSYYFIFTSAATRFYGGVGAGTTQLLGGYLSCASKQRNFGNFLSNLSIAYSGVPLSNSTLYDVALGSSLNISALDACMGHVVTSLDYQAQLASLYSVATVPEFVLNCKYATIPQTLNMALNYSLGQMKG